MAKPIVPFVPRSIAGTLSHIASGAIGKDWPLYAQLLDHWPEIVGPDYAQSTLPVKISFPKGKPAGTAWLHGKRTDGVLHIQAPKGLILTLTYQTEQIKQRIAACFGFSAIEKVVFEPVYGLKQPDSAPLPPPVADPQKMAQLEKQTNDIEDNALREALQKLGESVINHG